MIETDCAYLAGIIDGEGSISMVRSHATRITKSYYYPLVRIANTDKSLIDWIIDRIPFGHTMSIHRPNIKSKMVYHIGWASSDAERILLEVWPYLLIKKAQAREVFRMCIMNRLAEYEAGGKFGRGRELPMWLSDARERIASKVQALNRKGWTDAVDEERLEDPGRHDEGVRG